MDNNCDQCQKTLPTNGMLINVQHFHDRYFNFCSSRCLLEFALAEYLQFTDQQLKEAREKLHDASVSAATALAHDPNVLNSLMFRVREVETKLFLINRKK